MVVGISTAGMESGTMDPKSLTRYMGTCLACVNDVVDTYQGLPIGSANDTIMAVFGVPDTYENDPERACRAAMEINTVLAHKVSEFGFKPVVHTGISSGSVIVAGTATETFHKYLLFGETMERARKLKEASKASETLVAPDTYALTSHLFSFECVSPLSAYRLIATLPQSSGFGTLACHGIGSVMVGRKAETVVIRRRLERLMHGEGAFISIMGEAGVGKTRLMSEIRDHLPSKSGARQLVWLQGSALSLGKVTSYRPFQEIIRQYTGIAEKHGLQEAWHKLLTSVAALFGDSTPEIVPYVATLISLPVPENLLERVKYLDGEAMRRQIFLSSRRLFERVSRSQPLVLVFEDMQWVDESSARLLEHLVPLVYHASILIFCVSRPSSGTPDSRLRDLVGSVYHERFTEIPLTPLPPNHSARLVANILGNENPPEDLKALILRKSEGNPLFIEEIFRSLIDQSLLKRDPDTQVWEPEHGIETIGIPATIHGLVMSRVGRLSDDLQHLLRVAAVVGRSFNPRIVMDIAGNQGGFGRQLRQLETTELIREKHQVPELQYMFSHDLIHESVYESIPPLERRNLHEKIGGAIVRLFSDRLEDFFSLLAYHYARAEVWEKAQKYLLKAGDQAEAVAADSEALVHYQSAVSAYSQAFGDNWSSMERASLERKMGEAFFRRAEHERAVEYLHRCLQYLGKPSPTSQGETLKRLLNEIVRQIYHRFFSGRLPKHKPVETALEEEIRAYGILCWISAYKDTTRFLLYSITMLNNSETGGFGYGKSRGLVGLGITCSFAALHRLASYYYGRTIAVAEEVQHPAALAYGHLGMVLGNMALAWWKVAREYSDKAVSQFRKVGDLHSMGYSLHTKAVSLTFMGDYASALEACRNGQEIGQDSGDVEISALNWFSEASILLRQGRLKRAEEAFHRARDLANEVKNPVYQIGSWHELMVCHLRQHRIEEALRGVEHLQNLIMEYAKTGFLCIPSRSVIAETYLLKAEQSRKRERNEWLQKAGSACKGALKQSRACYGVRPECMRLMGTYYWLRGKPRSAEKWWLRSLALSEGRGQRYDTAVILLEMGRRLRNREYLDRAERIFVNIGAAWDLESLREARSSL
jgi:tetratricopeptide (TPR) repeat protein